MNSISSVRLTVPKTAAGEIIRQNLIDTVLNAQIKFVHIQAGAGYGKTTFLSQIANFSTKAVWFSLAGESDILTFVDGLSKAIRITFPNYDFAVSEYLPFINKNNFTTLLANAVICSMEKLPENFTLILDDLHTVKSYQIYEFIACFMKYAPNNIHVFIGSRESLHKELLPFYLKGNLLKLNQNEIAFTEEETFKILGYKDQEIYAITEGWPLAVGSLRILLENGVSSDHVLEIAKKTIYSYLFYECIGHLPSEVVEFLKVSACFEELDAQMLDAVLNIKNSRLMLDSLVSRNMFTIKTDSGHYRYHALFRDGLLEKGDSKLYDSLLQKAVKFYCEKKDYSKAAGYAIQLDDKKLLEEVILLSYKSLIKSGDFGELRLWFNALGEDISGLGPEILVSKGIFLSCIGNFTGAKECLDKAIPQIISNKEQLTEALIHKARVLRNYVSIEESNKVLDKLISEADNLASESGYAIIIEKLYNLCWDSKITDALKLCFGMIEACSREGNLKVKAWFERYLSAIYFFCGNMKKTVYYYEKSLELSNSELEYLDMHNTGIFAAKAYQMLGNRSECMTVLNSELQKMRSTGKYEEMWFGYLFAAEIHYQDTWINIVNGINCSYETTKKYFTLADEYAPLFRKTDFQMQWAKMLRLTYSLIFTNESKQEITNKISLLLDDAGDYLKSIILARLLGYFAAVSDYQNAVKCSKQCIEIGEKSKIYLHSSLAYGVIARFYISSGTKKEALFYTERFLTLCDENGIYAYFYARKDYDPVLKFAYENNIVPDITKKLMELVGYKIKKAYIKTFGGFSVLSYNHRDRTLKMRTKKERELLAYLLEAGDQGVSKEEIYEAVWPETESDNVKKLIGVNLAQIKKDLTGLGIENAVICHDKRYSICRDEIECDFEIFENKAADLDKKHPEELMGLYTGEYLSDFEALWANSKRIKYKKIVDELNALSKKN
ncbi:MAG: winged helix-turn-helix domain-containing protein [Bacillota bacterium]|nr:winged helix-turn-helix domain-containing protein [Bacillota bacterium]